jgi:hypothetical protein
MSSEIPLCYFCNAESTSVEHVPAKAFLGNSFEDLQLCTVPSCTKHNNDKSNLDEIVGNFMIQPTVVFKGSSIPTIKQIDKLGETGKKYGYYYNKEMATVEVIDSTFLDSLGEYFKMLLAGTYYGIYYERNREYIKLRKNLTNEYPYCKYISFFQIKVHNYKGVNKELISDNEIISKLKSHSRLKINHVFHKKFKGEISEFILNINMQVHFETNPVLIENGDILILSYIHDTLCAVGVFSKNQAVTVIGHTISNYHLE